MSHIIRFRDLEPSWATKQAKEPGFMRWLVTWVGGPPGHINTNPGTAVESDQCAVGMMYLPRGQRQAGMHTHGVTEIYVVLRGELEGFDASGHPHRAGQGDCTYIPPGCPHGVRNSGMEDVVLIWVHDGIERNGTAVYYSDDHVFGDVPSIQLVHFVDLEPDWSGPGARVPGTMHWSVNWVHGGETSSHAMPRGAIRNHRVSIGQTAVDPGHTLPSRASAVTRLWLVTGGSAIVNAGAGNEVLGELDGLHVSSGEAVAIRNNGPGVLTLLWVDSVPHPAD
jgi:mannose-6-phosphate isomerase-like protein (cupin superfamily)